jgi:hypothetical protein
MLGAAFYAVAPRLMIGPRWFRVLSISIGPAVVVGEMLVHTDGVDFVVLDPVGAGDRAVRAHPWLYALG